MKTFLLCIFVLGLGVSTSMAQTKDSLSNVSLSFSKKKKLTYSFFKKDTVVAQLSTVKSCVLITRTPADEAADGQSIKHFISYIDESIKNDPFRDHFKPLTLSTY